MDEAMGYIDCQNYIPPAKQPGDEWLVGAITPARIRPYGEIAPVKRVALFAEAFVPKQDGVSKTAALVARHLKNTGREVIIFTPDMDGRTLPCFDGMRVYPVQPAFDMPRAPESKAAWFARFDPAIYELLDDFQPDLIHLFSAAALSWAGAVYGHRHNIPTIANYQTDLPGYSKLYAQLYPSLFWFRYLHAPVWRILRRIHNLSHLTLAPTETFKEQLQAWKFRRVRLWARGVEHGRFDPSYATPEVRQALLNGQKDALRVLYVGRLATEKRVDLLADVAALPGVALTIVGDGSEREELQRLMPQANFVGKKYGDELSQLYASADVFAFTGTHETFGQVVTEAMSSGLPVLVPYSGGVVSLVKHGATGYVCAIDPLDYCRRIEYLRDHPDERERLARNALASVKDLTWEKIMEELEGHYWQAYQWSRDLSSGKLSRYKFKRLS